MTPLTTTLVVFVVIFSSAFVGLALAPFLKDHHLDDNSREIFKATRNVIVGLTALSLGLLVSQAKSDYQRKKDEIKSQAANAILLDRVLTDYGPESEPVKVALRGVLLNEIHQIEAAAADRHDPAKAIALSRMERLRPELLNLQPANEAQAWLKTTALAIAQQVVASRWKIYQELASNIDKPVLMLMVFWLIGIFFSLGVITPPHVISLGGIFVSAVSVSGAIYIALEMDMPFQGLITISPRPLELAMQQIVSPS